jgi:hypothetical protein
MKATNCSLPTKDSTFGKSKEFNQICLEKAANQTSKEIVPHIEKTKSAI